MSTRTTIPAHSLGAAINTAYHTDVFEQYGAQADAEIAKIIGDNEVVSHASAAKSSARSVATREQARNAG